MLRCVLLLLLGLFLVASPVLAEETPIKETKEEKPAKEVEAVKGHYAPDTCGFEITFPDAPYTSKRCPEGVSRCYDLTGYTMVYDVRTTVDVSVTCVPSSPANYKKYNERVIRAALNGMVNRANISEFNINTQEKDGIRQGTLIGSGTYGRQERIYNAQLWVGPDSVFTVEAKLIGPKHPEADTVYREILKSIRVKETD